MHTHHSRSYGYYKCASAHRSTQATRCGNRSHRIEQVDEAVWSLLVARLRDPSLLLQTFEGQDGEEDDWSAKLAEYARRQRKLERLQLEVLALCRDDLLTEGACRRRLEEIKTDLSTLESIIPRLPGYGVTLFPDGRVDVVGALNISTECPDAAVVPWSASLR